MRGLVVGLIRKCLCELWKMLWECELWWNVGRHLHRT
ncbi:unnamed protein product [Spirodela intermedia]|uniref:Uncharacterized protein n=1 Tax=Spirodela intermedia TaxID=51605 RepID=A0A7I8L9K3_SPIIN|nr:unnamed protein product [Spirodela intermedia]